LLSFRDLFPESSPALAPPPNTDAPPATLPPGVSQRPDQNNGIVFSIPETTGQRPVRQRHPTPTLSFRDLFPESSPALAHPPKPRHCAPACNPHCKPPRFMPASPVFRFKAIIPCSISGFSSSSAASASSPALSMPLPAAAE